MYTILQESDPLYRTRRRTVEVVVVERDEPLEALDLVLLQLAVDHDGRLLRHRLVDGVRDAEQGRDVDSVT